MKTQLEQKITNRQGSVLQERGNTSSGNGIGLFSLRQNDLRLNGSLARPPDVSSYRGRHETDRK